MPNYDFRCKKCKHEFDKIVLIAEADDERDCQKEDCDGKVERFMTTVSIATRITRKAGRWGGDIVKHRQKFD